MTLALASRGQAAYTTDTTVTMERASTAPLGAPLGDPTLGLGEVAPPRGDPTLGLGEVAPPRGEEARGDPIVPVLVKVLVLSWFICLATCSKTQTIT